MARLCGVCGKPLNVGLYYFILKTSLENIQEEVFLCESCKASFEAGASPVTRVYGSAHMQEKETFFWHNKKPLQPNQALDPFSMPLSNYPLIEDFEVGVECWVEPQKSGKDAWHASARFISPSRGYLTYALDVDLSRPNFTLPQGNFDQPYRLDAGWDTLWTLIAEKDEFVYIQTDNETFTLIHGKRTYLYHAWFRVERNRYYSQWKQAIYLAQSLFAEQKG